MLPQEQKATRKMLATPRGVERKRPYNGFNTQDSSHGLTSGCERQGETINNTSQQIAMEEGKEKEKK